MNTTNQINCRVISFQMSADLREGQDSSARRPFFTVTVRATGPGFEATLVARRNRKNSVPVLDFQHSKIDPTCEWALANRVLELLAQIRGAAAEVVVNTLTTAMGSVKDQVVLTFGLSTKPEQRTPLDALYGQGSPGQQVPTLPELAKQVSVLSARLGFAQNPWEFNAVRQTLLDTVLAVTPRPCEPTVAVWGSVAWGSENEHSVTLYRVGVRGNILLAQGADPGLGGGPQTLLVPGKDLNRIMQYMADHSVAAHPGTPPGLSLDSVHLSVGVPALTANPMGRACAKRYWLLTPLLRNGRHIIFPDVGDSPVLMRALADAVAGLATSDGHKG